jgi:formamidopyrimidine-DNA glycosylase
MPELPEVENNPKRRNALGLKSQQITDMSVRQASLRWPVTDGIEEMVIGQRVGGCYQASKVSHHYTRKRVYVSSLRYEWKFACC